MPALLDAERDRLVARLRLQCTDGRISLEEFSDLVGEVFAARTRADLERIAAATLPVPAPVAVLPTEARPTRGGRARQTVSRRFRYRGRWLVAVFGQSVRTGRYRLEDESVALAVFGDCTIDLSAAVIDASEVKIGAIALFGEVTVIVPDGVDVAMEGGAFFGTRRCDVAGPAPARGAPVLVIHAMACFGDVRVRSPRTPRSSRSSIR